MAEAPSSPIGSGIPFFRRSLLLPERNCNTSSSSRDAYEKRSFRPFQSHFHSHTSPSSCRAGPNGASSPSRRFLSCAIELERQSGESYLQVAEKTTDDRQTDIYLSNRLEVLPPYGIERRIRDGGDGIRACSRKPRNMKSGI